MNLLKWPDLKMSPPLPDRGLLIITPNTLAGPPPKILFFLPSPEHKKGGFDFSAARPPYRLYLGLWMELNNDCSIHLILHCRALLSVIQYRRCDALPLS